MKHEPGAARGQHVLGVVAGAGLRAAVGDAGHAERGRVVVRGLLGVADHERDVVDALDRERVVRCRGCARCRRASIGAVTRASSGSCGDARPWRSTVGNQSRSLLVAVVYRHVELACPSCGWTICPSMHRRAGCQPRSPCWPSEPRIGVLECARRLRRGPGHRPGPAGQAGRPRRDPGLRPGRLAGRAGLRGDRVRDAGDPPAARARSGRRPPGRDPRGAGGAHHHRLRRPALPDRGPVQRRPAAGDRPDRGLRGRSCGPRRSSRWPSRSGTAPCRWSARPPLPDRYRPR